MPSRLERTSAVTEQFHLAMLRMGVRTLAELLGLWRRMSMADKLEQGGRWSAEASRLILTRRARARALGIAYYRLASALMTGSTVPDPDEPGPDTVTLNDLQDRFETLVRDESPSGARRETSDPAPRRTPSPQRAAASDLSGRGTSARGRRRPAPDPNTGIDLSEEPDMDAPVPVEAERMQDAEETTPQRQLADEVRIAVDGLGSANLRKRERGVDTTKPARDVDKQRKANDDAAGARTAAAGARITSDGSRDVVHDLTKRDRKAIGYARVSRSGTPCGFCAMLISRGVVYKSEASAGGKTSSAATVRRGQAAVGDEYHDHCRCEAVAVFSMAQFDTDPRFDLNREYGRLWGPVTRGHAGKAALTVWRRFIRERGSQSPARVA